jgi:hypothetical protein
MLKDEIEKKISIRKRQKKLELTRQTRDTSYKTELTTYKASHNKL